mgnify:FL=1
MSRNGDILLSCPVTKAVVIRGSCGECPGISSDRRSRDRRTKSISVRSNHRGQSRRMFAVCRGIVDHKEKDLSPLNLAGIMLHLLNKEFKKINSVK